VATLTRVQHNSMATTSTTAASLTATLGSGVTSGNLLVATIIVGTNVGTITPPSSWAQAGPTETVTGSLQAQIFYLVVGTGGATSFAFSWSGSHSFGWTIDEWSSSTGWQASPVDSSAGAVHTSASTAVNCGSPATTTQASELWYGVLSWANSGQSLSGITSGWTTGDTATFTGQNTQTGFYQAATTTGTPSLAATISASTVNAGVVATFMPVAGTTANAGLASGTGTSQQPTAQVTANAGLASGTGTAFQIPSPAGLAHGTGTAFNPQFSAPAGLASGTGTAQQPAAQVTANAGLAAGTGTAFQIPAPAGLAHGTGTAQSPGPLVVPGAGLASGTGTAFPGSVHQLRSPLNLGATLTESTPNGAMTLVTIDAAFTLADYRATLTLASYGAHLTGWTMQTAPLNLNEFNDVTISIAVTQNGSPYNLAGVTLNLLLKTQAGTPDANALIFSSSGGSPAITITNAAQGLATAIIPNTDLDAEVYNFYRLDVVASSLTNTTLFGPITWTTL
jgi:hypothetical protein